LSNCPGSRIIQHILRIQIITIPITTTTTTRNVSSATTTTTRGSISGVRPSPTTTNLRGTTPCHDRHPAAASEHNAPPPTGELSQGHKASNL